MLRKKWLKKKMLAGGIVLLFSGPVHAAVEKGPYLIYDGVNTEMTVLWQLDSTQSCTIDWGTGLTYSTGTGSTVESGSGQYEHQHIYTITGLTPATQYFYTVSCNPDNVGSGSFYAAPLDDASSVKILAYGDTRSYPADHNAVSAQMINTYSLDQGYQTITLHVGDWVNNGDVESDWAYQFFDPYYTSTNEFQANMPLIGCKGNHEDSGTLFYKYFPYLYEPGGFYWSFDYGPAHIAVIDQYVSYSPGSTQYEWLANDLASSAKEWKFLVFHEPGWSAGGHSNESAVQNYIQPLAIQHGVDLIFAGHNHYYARAVVDGIHHITTGGGGAPLYAPNPNADNIVAATAAHHFCEVDIQGDNLSFIARDKYGAVIDSFEMGQTPDPNLPPQANFSSTVADLLVSFTDASTDSDGSIVTRSWDFGDGSGSSETGPSHSYSASGTYTVILTVTDDDGATDTATQQVTVTDPNEISAPVALAAVVDGNTVDLSWQDTSGNEEGFSVERAEKIRGKYNFTVIGTTAVNATGYQDTGVTAGTFKYRVRGFAGDTFSDYSSEALVKVEETAPASFCGDGTCDADEIGICPADCSAGSLPKGAPCTSDTDCQSGSCHPIKSTCK